MLGRPVNKPAFFEVTVIWVQNSVDNLLWFRRDTADSMGQAYRTAEVQLIAKDEELFFGERVPRWENLSEVRASCPAL